jgi:hypothetical protein
LHQASGRQLAPSRIEAAARRLAGAGGLVVRDLELAPGLYGAVACVGIPRLARVRRFPVDRQAIARLFADHPRVWRVAGGERLR